MDGFALDPKQQADFIEYGRIVSCDDPEVVKQLGLAGAHPQAWLDWHREQEGEDCSCGLCWDGEESADEIELFYPKVMMDTLSPYLISFWHNMGDLTAWVMGSAKARNVSLDRERIREDLKPVQEDNSTPKYEWVELAIAAVGEALERQGASLCPLLNPYEGSNNACVASGSEETLLGQCSESWVDPWELF